MAYDEPPTPARLTRPDQGQRCVSCGHLEPDPWARFCGVCGGTLAATGAPTNVTNAPHKPPVQYAPSAPPAQPYGAYQVGPSYGPQPITYTIPSVGFAGSARIGAAVAAAFTLVPCVLFGFLGAWLVHAGRDLLQSWINASVRVPVPLVSVDLNMNFIELLKLRSLFDVFIYWDDRLWLTFALLWLVPWVLWIVAGALFGVILAAVYNIVGKLGGGVRVTLSPDAQAAARPAVSSTVWPQGTQPGPPAGWSGPPEPRR
jgi:hypothetical protein